VVKLKLMVQRLNFSMSRQAFTLVELLVVISIIGLLSSVAVVSFSGTRGKAQIAAGQSFERSILNTEGDAILAQWDFNDCTGTEIPATTIADISGNGNNATPTSSPQWSSDTPDQSGCSLSLNGTSQYAVASRSISELANNSFTVSFWVKRSTISRNDYAFSLGAVGPYQYLVMGYRNSNTFTCTFYGDDLDTTTAYIDTNWHLWACSYDAVSNKRSLYRDGALVRSDSPVADFSGTGAPQIGHYASSFYFQGNMDNVRIFTKSLTVETVKKLYAEGRKSHPNEVAAR
jgi:prepilin-type N-terminal cleavage/methylation domain-containing protein